MYFSCLAYDRVMHTHIHYCTSHFTNWIWYTRVCVRACLCVSYVRWSIECCRSSFSILIWYSLCFSFRLAFLAAWNCFGSMNVLMWDWPCVHVFSLFLDVCIICTLYNKNSKKKTISLYLIHTKRKHMYKFGFSINSHWFVCTVPFFSVNRCAPQFLRSFSVEL